MVSISHLFDILIGFEYNYDSKTESPTHTYSDKKNFISNIQKKLQSQELPEKQEKLK